MKNISVAILGAGISGLTFAAQLSKLPQISYKIFEQSQYLRGRIFTQHNNSQRYADMGANIIDFDSKEQECLFRQFLISLEGGEKLNKKIEVFKDPFLIYDQKLKEGDHKKDRYFYKGGFNVLIQDISDNIQKQSIQYNFRVNFLKRNKGEWSIYNESNTQFKEKYDYLVFAIDGSALKSVVQKSELTFQNLNIKNLLDVEYTTQIAAAFTMNNHLPFSCILFKNHPITFISSHKQKYPDQENISVIQMNQLFSNSFFNQQDKVIQQKILNELPQEIKHWVKQCIYVKKWRSSLIKYKIKRQISDFQSLKDQALFIGDIVYGSSRVTGAVESSIKIFKMFERLINDKLKNIQ